MAEKWPRDLWLDAIWEDEALRPQERVVAYVYARLAFERDTAWATYDEVMRRTGMHSRKNVAAAVRALVAAGWLTAVERARQHRSTVYRLTVPLGRTSSSQGGTAEHDDSSSQGGTAEWPSSSVSDASSSDLALQQFLSGDPRTHMRTQIENSPLRQRASDPPGSPAGAVCSTCNGKRFVVTGAGVSDYCHCHPHHEKRTAA